MLPRQDDATDGSTSTFRTGTLQRLRLASTAEANSGNIEASRVISRILASIPEDASDIVQTACAIEAIEREDYAAWPSTWLISSLLPYLQNDLSRWCSGTDLTSFQRTRYQELFGQPHLLQGIAHGFTRKLHVRDKQGFIDELILAGRGESNRGDEASAIDEENVVHVALSYKHMNHFSMGGTIDYYTAEEAYDVIYTVLRISGWVRVWIDQNLHRYATNRPNYERNLLPFAVMPVVSALSGRGGFAICCRRPWVWVDTGIALSALGIHCKPDMCSTIKDVIVYPQGSLVDKFTLEGTGAIIGLGMSVFDSISQILRSISWWTPDVFSHEDYEYVTLFKEFIQWAKAQVVRLNRKGRLDLSSDLFEDTILENICWMKSLPVDSSSRQWLQSPYLRLDLDVRKAHKNLALLQASGKCQKVDGIYEFLGTSTGLKTFCFTKSSNTLSLNVNPSQRSMKLRVGDAEGYQEGIADFEALTTSQGGYSLWDQRFPFHEMPRFLNCGTIFGRHFGMRDRLGKLGCNINLGGFSFTREGFSSVGFRVEGVYVSRSKHGEIYLCESDVLCIQELNEDLQNELLRALSRQEAFPSMARILKAESDITDLRLTPRTVGTTTSDIERAIWKLQGEDVGADEVNIRRIRLGQCLHTIAIDDNRFGKLVYTFQTTVAVEASLADLLHFKTVGDINMTSSKIRLMMGSDEFSNYANDGLSLGIGIHIGKERYQYEFRLEGSEFMLCHECKAIYSPINLTVCALSSNMRTRKIKAQWGEMHSCSKGGLTCNIIGVTE